MKLAETEFHLVANLECDLMAVHPNPTYGAMLKRGLSVIPDGVGVRMENVLRYWEIGEA